MIKREAKKLIKKGEKIIEEESTPEKEGGVRNIIMGKRLQQAGQQRIEDYEEGLETTEEWIAAGEHIIREGHKTEAEGKALKKYGDKLIRDNENREKG